MDALDSPLGPEALLRQAAWMRRLAERLVRDGSGEDVAQDALVVAIEHDARHAGARRMRAWLAAVTRNVAVRRRRRDDLRQDFERAAARAESQESAGAIVERMEVQRLLVEALLRLDEPYRSAVIWRHQDELAPAEIARRQGCSVDAARQHVARGLARLRADLDRRHGPRAWRALFLAQLDLARDAGVAAGTGSGGSAAASVVLGGAWMSSKIVGACGAMVIALLGWASWRAWKSSHPPEDERAAASVDPLPPPTSASGARGRDSAHAALGADGAQREELAPATRSLVGVVRDPGGAPIERATVRIDRGATAPHDAHVTHTDAAGRFALEIERALLAASPAVEIHASAPGRATAAVRVEAGRDDYELVLAPAGGIRVRVVDVDGIPVESEGARVRIEATSLADGSVGEWHVPRSDTGGFFLPGPPSALRVAAVKGRARGFAETRREVGAVVEPGGLLELELALELGLTVRGVVLDAETRAPIAGAEVWADGWRSEPSAELPFATSGASGRFELHGVGHTVSIDVEEKVVDGALVRSGYAHGEEIEVLLHLRITAAKLGYCTDPHRRIDTWTTPPAGVVDGVEILLAPARASLRGRVAEPDGSAPGGRVEILCSDALGVLHSSTADESGAFAVEALPPGPYTLIAYPGQRVAPAERRAAVRSGELDAGEQAAFDLTLEPATASFAGRVAGPDGRAIAGARVHYTSWSHTPDGMIGLASGTVTTDDEGRYALERIYVGSLSCNVASTGEALVVRPQHREVEAVAATRVDALDFEAAPAIAVEGVIEGAPDPQTLDVIVQSLADPAHDRHGTRPDAGGRFRLDGVFPEPCTLTVRRGGRELARVEIPASGASGLVLRVSE